MDHTEADLRKMGYDEAVIQAQMAALAAAKPDPEDFEVYPENWPVLALFKRLKTCWRVGGMGEVLGLSYPDVEVVMRRRKVEDPDSMFDLVQEMEYAALTEWQEAAGG